MKETERIIKLFEDLYEGSPWIGVNIIGTLENLTAKQAAKTVLAGRNSIWEITNHIISWRFNVLQRVQGKIMVTPDHNYFLPIKDTSESDWTNTLNQLKDSQRQWINFMNTFKENDFSKVYRNDSTYYEQIHGLIQHDAYHLGQIILLAKLFN